MMMAKDAVYMGPLGSGNVTKLFKNMVTAAEALVVYEALQMAKAAGINLKSALEVMQKTKSRHVLDRWDMRFDISNGDVTFRAGANFYDKDLPLAAESEDPRGRYARCRATGSIGRPPERRKVQYINHAGEHQKQTLSWSRR